MFLEDLLETINENSINIDYEIYNNIINDSIKKTKKVKTFVGRSKHQNQKSLGVKRKTFTFK